jgi:multidrug resistance protein, MATE family
VAILYVRCRCFGFVPALLLFVAAGTFRGCKDTATLAKLAFATVSLNLVLVVLFVMHLNWGVAGAAAATVIAQVRLAEGIGAGGNSGRRE